MHLNQERDALICETVSKYTSITDTPLFFPWQSSTQIFSHLTRSFGKCDHYLVTLSWSFKLRDKSTNLYYNQQK